MVDKDLWVKVVKAVEMMDEGFSCAETANALNTTTETIRRYLVLAYTGKDERIGRMAERLLLKRNPIKAVFLYETGRVAWKAKTTRIPNNPSGNLNHQQAIESE